MDFFSLILWLILIKENQPMGTFRSIKFAKKIEQGLESEVLGAKDYCSYWDRL
jgi:hypothetical protein